MQIFISEDCVSNSKQVAFLRMNLYQRSSCEFQKLWWPLP